MRFLASVLLSMAVSLPAMAQDDGVPSGARKAAQRLLGKAAKCKTYKAFRKKHKKMRPLTSVYLAVREKGAKEMMGAVEASNGPATGIVRKQGSFAVLAPSGKKPADAIAKSEQAGRGTQRYQLGASEDGAMEHWEPVLYLRFEVDLNKRSIILELHEGPRGGEPAWRGSGKW